MVGGTRGQVGDIPDGTGHAGDYAEVPHEVQAPPEREIARRILSESVPALRQKALSTVGLRGYTAAVWMSL